MESGTSPTVSILNWLFQHQHNILRLLANFFAIIRLELDTSLFFFVFFLNKNNQWLLALVMLM